ncbi:hypothetical protein ASE12_00090 [Aeromicrobium sp. Root236]|uniref:DUF1761 domain-containing protein n=1 Tax=Aeromicrobium sp. Root236 TaxID=1736498 RepID=UPI0006F83393|nr:DUF1761 domain-containing protein [Aeromicrobium sp. Root236]KRC63296.1 hypothetical protein ASE12_00090 [Aeromicrobium sp. Root236]
MADLSIPGIVVAALAFSFLGVLWYGVMFGRTWQVASGLADDPTGTWPHPIVLGATMLVGLVLAFALATQIDADGVEHGFLLGLGAGAAAGLITLGRHRRRDSWSLTGFAVDAGYFVVGTALMGLIVGAFQAS